MKTLMILRHAKSSWDNSQLSDHQRPLNKRGLHDASLMGRLLYREDLLPNMIITSTAKRAADTADLAALAASYEGDIIYTDDLYLADPEAYVKLARKVEGPVKSILMVGHNPGIEELVEALSGHAERMPTAALAVFKIDIASWRELNLDRPSKLVNVWLPKTLV